MSVCFLFCLITIISLAHKLEFYSPGLVFHASELKTHSIVWGVCVGL